MTMNSNKQMFFQGMGSKTGSEYIDLEKFRPYRVYAITYSPLKQPSSIEKRSLVTYHHEVIKEFQELGDMKWVYTFMPEFGKNNRLHYHGLIAFSNGYSYLKFKDHVITEHVVIKEIFGEAKKWYDYCVKQWTHLKGIFTTPFTNNGKLLPDYFEQMVWCRFDALADDPN